MRVFMGIKYRGTAYHGWQTQPNGVTVQETIEKALSMLIRQKITIVGSGRTDAGVHATGQIAHTELPEDTDLQHLHFKLNAVLPGDIAITFIKKVQADASARYSATSRTYRYFIHRNKDPFKDGISWYNWAELNVANIQACCDILKQHTDFECFSLTATDVKHFHCQITAANWLETSDGYQFEITANRFLRGMVRAIVGTLVKAGRGKLSPEEFTFILESRKRMQAGDAAPAQGLFLVNVTYPDSIYLD